jgi:hypothetical protein
MRSLSLVDIVVILAVVAVLLFAGSKDFARYSNSTVTPVPTTAQPAS